MVVPAIILVDSGPVITVCILLSQTLCFKPLYTLSWIIKNLFLLTARLMISLFSRFDYCLGLKKGLVIKDNKILPTTVIVICGR